MLSWRAWAISSSAGLALSFFAGLKLHDNISHLLHPSVIPAVYGFSVDFLNRFPPRGEVVFLGDSHIARVDWNALLGRNDTVNFGISGDTARGVLLRLRPVILSDAKQIVLMIGVNDITEGKRPDDVADDIRQIITQLSRKSKVAVLAVMMTTGKYSHLNNDIRKLNEILRHVCANECKFIDTTSLIGRSALDERVSLDGLHLNVEGYEKLAWAIKRELFTQP